LGRRLAAALAGGHGGELGYWEEDGKERERERTRRRKKGGGVAWRPGLLQGTDSSFVGKQEVAAQVTWQPPRSCSR
jgi:hypothetical protein